MLSQKIEKKSVYDKVAERDQNGGFESSPQGEKDEQADERCDKAGGIIKKDDLAKMFLRIILTSAKVKE